jgi:hypothetical protein
MSLVTLGSSASLDTDVEGVAAQRLMRHARQLSADLGYRG